MQFYMLLYIVLYDDVYDDDLDVDVDDGDDDDDQHAVKALRFWAIAISHGHRTQRFCCIP